MWDEQRLKFRPVLAEDKPVRGGDIVRLRDEVKTVFDSNDVMWQLALNRHYYTRAISRKLPSSDNPDVSAFDAPISDITRATMIRMLSSHPECWMLPEPPTSGELFALIRSAEGFDIFNKGDFGLCFGSEPSAGYRWLQPIGGEPGPRRSTVVARAMTMVFQQLEPRTPLQRAQFMALWIRALVKEHATRGVPLDELTSGGGDGRGSFRGSEIWQLCHDGSFLKRIFPDTTTSKPRRKAPSPEEMARQVAEVGNSRAA